eukprot:m.370957 g.370957  ORF g.370957 m.370957 type:complete len:126 (-) comp20863_c0_seq7:2838-3215(-)
MTYTLAQELPVHTVQNQSYLKYRQRELLMDYTRRLQSLGALHRASMQHMSHSTPVRVTWWPNHTTTQRPTHNQSTVTNARTAQRPTHNPPTVASPHTHTHNPPTQTTHCSQSTHTHTFTTSPLQG